MRILLIQLAAILLLPLNYNAAAQENTNVISGKWLQYSDAKNSLYHYLADTACKLLKRRADEVSHINTTDGWLQRQVFIRKGLLECIGGFPAKTPLNARILKIVEKETFRVEHIIFESVPGFFVTSSLYLPSGKKKTRYPAIIYCSGHNDDGYRNDVYQHVILNLVRKGFIVFAFDPVGQGERLEYYDQKTGKSAVGIGTAEHSYAGAQAFLTGSSQAMYMIWDGIRAVDYLMSRKEVDTLRIGITGRSGGGTQSAYIAAFDERIYAVAPENYITSYTRLLQTIGPQDAEQNLPVFIGRGLDHGDFLIVRAPKPALMITTSDDMFTIQGAKETEAEVSRIYQALGKPQNFSRCEDDAGHASTKKNRESMYAFFQRHLSNPGNTFDEQITFLTHEELKVTSTGQVSTSLKSLTVFALNMKRAENLENQMELMRIDSLKYPGCISEYAKRLSGYSDPSAKGEPVFSGRVQLGGHVMERYFLKGEGNYIIPYILLRPEKANGKAIICIYPDGKSSAAKPGSIAEKFVLNGYTVLAPDLVGTGETGPGDLHGDAWFSGASHNLWYASLLTGRSITGTRAADVAKLANVLSDLGFADITGFAKSDMAPVLLHAAVFSVKIHSIILSGMYSSYMSLATHRFYNPFFIQSCVPGSIGNYDLSDLAASFSPGKLIIEDATDCLGTKTYSDEIMRDLEVVKKAYAKKNSEDELMISENAIDAAQIIEFLQ